MSTLYRDSFNRMREFLTKLLVCVRLFVFCVFVVFCPFGILESSLLSAISSSFGPFHIPPLALASPYFRISQFLCWPDQLSFSFFTVLLLALPQTSRAFPRGTFLLSWDVWALQV